MNYDLEERTAKFSLSLINFCKVVKTTLTNENIIKQVLRSGTSVGANYREANGATSKTDFKSKIHICKKEANETLYWLRLLANEIEEKQKIVVRELWTESKELLLIFSKIASSSKL
jgi:four helix bundle protein